MFFFSKYVLEKDFLKLDIYLFVSSTLWILCKIFSSTNNTYNIYNIANENFHSIII